MSKGGNVLEMGKALANELEILRAEVPAGIQIDTVSFQPKVVEESVGEFVKSFLEALIIVLIVSFISLGLRTGIVVALSVPLVLAISLVIMNAMGMNLDRISLGALILALGLLVDDAIIAIEMMVVKMEEGMDRVAAAAYAWSHTAAPMLSGTLVTVIGLMPVGFAQSSSGEYAGNIFWIVGFALIASWVVAVAFTPYLGVKLLSEVANVQRTDTHKKKLLQTLQRVVINVKGSLLAMRDVLIEIWQADAKGHYAHPADPKPSAWRGWGRCTG
jgi:multidrug efflux pump subunit AcrB